MKKLNLVKSLSIAERMHILSPYSNETKSNVAKQLENWQKRKSLCKQQHFEEALKCLAIDPVAFSSGIKPLDQKDKELLWEPLRQKKWFKLNQEIFDQANETDQIEAVDFSYVMRFHMAYFQKKFQLLDSSYFDYYARSFQKINAYVAEDLVSISLKTLVVDLHDQKKKNRLRGITSDERFRSYLQLRFSTPHTFAEFFEEYPVLWRLLAERLQFHIENFVYFITSVDQSFKELEKLFDISGPAHLQIDSVGHGDSHEKGKNVIVFFLNDQKLVFKFRNLMIGQKWNEFLSFIEQKTGSSFYKIKRVATPRYTIEEFIETKSCTCEKELQQYYYRFGEYVAICYFLCGNDFHSENLIAHGNYPVLIDIETLMQNDSSLVESRGLYEQATKIKNESILSTGLLPTSCFTNRIEPKVKASSNEKFGVQSSGFNGNRQVLPFKVLKVVEDRTDQIHFEYQKHYSKETGNIPELNSQMVNPLNYAEEVMRGFVAQYDFFSANKPFLIKKIKDLFKESNVRVLLKSTQKYVDMLEYGQHVSCMKDYLEREKLFENKWAYPYKDKRAVRYEIEDLRVNDIPIFFSNVSTKDLYTSANRVLNDYHSRSALERVSARIAALNSKDKAYQLMLLNQSIKEQPVISTSYQLGNQPEEQIETIVQHILNRTLTSADDQEMVLLDFVLENGKKIYEVATHDFYDGMAGIYIFLLYAQEFYPDIQKYKILQAMEKMLFADTIPDIGSASVYVGTLSRMTALYYRYRLKRDKKSLAQVLVLVSKLKKQLIKSHYEIDWLTGISGLIKLLAEFYTLTTNELFIDLAEALVAKLNISTVKFNGLAHGASGVLLALSALLPFTKKRAQYLVLIQKCLLHERKNFDGKVWQDLRENVDFLTQWCHGCTGIGLARLALLKAGVSDENSRKELLACVDQVLAVELREDCLCHGNAASYIFLSEVYQTECIDEKRNKKIEQKLASIRRKLLERAVMIEGMDTYPMLGFMTGLSGIGYFWLRILHPEIPNILVLA